MQTIKVIRDFFIIIKIMQFNMRAILTEAKEKCVHGHRIHFKKYAGYKICTKSNDDNWYNTVIEGR
jgi:hypothetical protein